MLHVSLEVIAAPCPKQCCWQAIVELREQGAEGQWSWGHSFPSEESAVKFAVDQLNDPGSALSHAIASRLAKSKPAFVGARRGLSLIEGGKR